MTRDTSIFGGLLDGLSEHISDRTTYAEARSLARKLAPGIEFPEVPVCCEG